MTHLLKHHQKVSSLMLLSMPTSINSLLIIGIFVSQLPKKKGEYITRYFDREKKKKGHIITFITVYFMISYWCSSLSVSNLSIKLSHRYVYREKNHGVYMVRYYP